MNNTEREIRKMLRGDQDIHCLDLKSYIVTLDIAIHMPLGQVKAKIIKPEAMRAV